jgi:hypothetical protein
MIDQHEIDKYKKALTKAYPKKSDSTDYIRARIIERTAFLLAQADEVETELKENGSIELFIQGAQQLLREHPASKIHNNLIKSLNANYKMLIDISDGGVTECDPLKAFLNKK